MRILLLICCMSVSLLYGQETMTAKDTSDAKSAIGPISITAVYLSNEVHFGSNAISNDLINIGLWGGTLDEVLKDRISNNLMLENNFLAGELSSNIYLSRRDTGFISYDWTWQINAGYSQFTRLTFHKDIYDLAFYGNKRFQGSTAALDVQIEREHFQKIMFRLNHINGLWFGGGMYFGNDFISLNLSNSGLNTSVGLNQIDLFLNGSAHLSDTTRSGFFSGNGFGAGIEAGYLVRNQKKEKLLDIKIKDLGFMIWNRPSRQFKFNQSLTYQGFDINELLLDTYSFEGIQDTLELTSTNKRQVRILPFLISIGKPLSFENKKRTSVYYGLNYRYRYHKIPELFFGLGQSFSESTQVSAALAYGGFYNLHLQTNLFMELNKNFSLKVYSNAFINTIGSEGLGKSVGLNLIYVL